MTRTNRQTLRRMILPALLLAMLLLGGCQPEPEPATEPTMAPAEEVAAMLDLAGTAWIADYQGEPEAGAAAIEGARSTLNFSLSNYLGTGGCNWFQGVYSIESSSIFFRPPLQTQLSCTEPEGIMDQEGLYFGALFSATDYALEDDKLVLYRDGTQRLLTYSPAETVDVEGTNWGLKLIFNGATWFPVVIESEVSAQFVDGELSGNSGCNDYSATYEVDGNAVTIEGVTAGDEVCDVVDEVMAQETVYLEVLELVAGYEVLGGSLALLDANGDAIMFFGAQ